MKIIKFWLHIIFFSLFFFSQTLKADDDNYFSILSDIQKLPAAVQTIKPASYADKVKLLTALNFKDHDGDNLSIDKQGKIFLTLLSGTAEIYKGDFTNEKLTEYALVTTMGSGNFDSVELYKQNGNKFSYLDFTTELFYRLRGYYADAGAFYMNVARPFAFIWQGKTYVRYMAFPGKQQYLASSLRVCTYLWENNQIKLAPKLFNLAGSKSGIVPALDCDNASK